MRIALDVDGVVSDFRTSMIAFLKERYSIIIENEDDIVCWDWYKCPGVNMSKGEWVTAIGAYSDENRYAKQALYPGVQFAIISFVSSGYKVRLFTTAPIGAHDKLVGLLCGDISIMYCENEQEKVDSVVGWGANLYVDDSLSAYKRAFKSGYIGRVLLLDRSYNMRQAIEDSEGRVSMWADVVRAADDIAGKLSAVMGKTSATCTSDVTDCSSTPSDPTFGGSDETNKNILYTLAHLKKILTERSVYNAPQANIDIDSYFTPTLHGAHPLSRVADHLSLKYHRLLACIANDDTEHIEDHLIDICGYAVLAIAYCKGKKIIE